MLLSSEEVTSMPPIKKRNVTPVSKKDKRNATVRLLKYVTKFYLPEFIIVLLCVVIASIGSVCGSYFVGNILIKHFLSPAIYVIDPTTGNPQVINGAVQYNADPVGAFNSITYMGMHFTGVIIAMCVIFLLTVLASFFYNYLMAKISQGVQKRIRDELFSHMETLPVVYFDQHTHGDIMSIYTNDVDALREMLARALPMVASSIMTMVVCFVFMLLTDLLLTGI